MMIDDVDPGFSPVELAAELVMAWLSNPNTRVDADDIPAALKAMHGAVVDLTGLTTPTEIVADTKLEFTPAVSVRKSLGSRDHIISMIDGKPYRTLKRHLSTHGLTPDEYRERYGLKADYPLVAPSYAEARSALAKKIGLGRKPGPKARPKAAPVKPKAVAAVKGATKAHPGS